jgi:L,D-transpeptidase catalytic domain
VTRRRLRATDRAVVSALATGLVLAALAGCGSDSKGSAVTGATFQPTPTKAKDPTAGTPVKPTQAAKPAGTLSAELLRPSGLYTSPGGKWVAKLTKRTEWNSPRLLPVVARRGGWLGVIAAQMPNNRVGWIRNRGVRFYRSPYALQIQRAARKLVVRRNGKVLSRITVAVGRPGHETPIGRFGVTDKLLIKRYTPYGCCAIATSAAQPNIPQGWGGGDRIAIHATSDPGTIGQAVSLGCIRAPTDAMKRLVREIPLGTRVTVSA